MNALLRKIKINSGDVKHAIINKPLTIYKPVDDMPKNVSSVSDDSITKGIIDALIEHDGGFSLHTIEYYYDFDDRYLNYCNMRKTEIESVITILFTTIEAIGGEVFFEITLVATKM